LIIEAHNMAEIAPQPMPAMVWGDWLVVFCGLSIGIAGVFEALNWTTSFREDRRAAQKRLYSMKNVWLILSGVIHMWIEFHMSFYRDSSSIQPGLDMYAAAGMVKA